MLVPGDNELNKQFTYLPYTIGGMRRLVGFHWSFLGDT